MYELIVLASIIGGTDAIFPVYEQMRFETVEKSMEQTTEAIQHEIAPVGEDQDLYQKVVDEVVDFLRQAIELDAPCPKGRGFLSESTKRPSKACTNRPY